MSASSRGPIVCVPAHPLTGGGAGAADQTRIEFEFRVDADGRPRAVAFRHLSTLVAQLGAAQPWAGVDAAWFADLVERLGLGPVLMDPVVDPAAPRWTVADLERRYAADRARRTRELELRR